MRTSGPGHWRQRTVRLGQLPQHQHHMQNDHIEPAIDRVRHPITTIEFGGSRLRHDHAIESVDGAALGRAAKGERYHRVRWDSDGGVTLFVALSGYLGYAGPRPGCKQND